MKDQELKEIFRKYRGNAKMIGEHFAEDEAFSQILALLKAKLEGKKEGTEEELSHLGYGSQRFMQGFNQAIDTAIKVIEGELK